MEQDVLEKYRKAGRILAEVMDEARPKINVGVPLIEIAEFVEGSIRSKGAQPAFPCNISLDRAAAHYTPKPKDDITFNENMVKLDIGVHVDGYIADAAITVDLSGHTELTDASKAALEAAIELIEPGVNTAAIGSAIEQTIIGYGYKPVSNLTGHGLEKYDAHAEPVVPNRAIGKGTILKEGDVIARLDSDDLIAEKAQLEAQLVVSRFDLERAETEFATAESNFNYCRVHFLLSKI